MKIKNVLSLFNGFGGLAVALDYAEIEYDEFYYSEIDKYANLVMRKNYPDSIQLGDIHWVSKWRLPQIDLLCGGSPCQDLSCAGKGAGLKGSRSQLFWEYVRLLREVKPRWFILENVASMTKKNQDIITKELGVEPIMIDSALTSAQSRKRLYWTNISVEQPKDRGILLRDILESDAVTDREKSYCIDASYYKGGSVKEYFDKSRRQLVFTVKDGSEKGCVDIEKGECVDLRFPKSTTRRGQKMVEKLNMLVAQDPQFFLNNGWGLRKLLPIECERGMSLPDNYTQCEGVSNTQRYKMCGNGFECRAVAHVLGGIKD